MQLAQNKNLKLDINTLVDILTSIKRDDNIYFLKSILNFSNKEINLTFLENVFSSIKKNPDMEEDILDSFSRNQFLAKGQLVNYVKDLNILDDESEVVIFGCWYGSVLIPKLSSSVKRITGIDLDEKVIKIAKNNFFKDYENVEFSTGNVFDKNLSRFKETKLLVNTSCEHMPPMKEWPFWTKFNPDSYFAFTSNNMSAIQGHVNCVSSLEDFKAQLPNGFEVMAEDEIVDERGSRYLLVGKMSSQPFTDNQ